MIPTPHSDLTIGHGTHPGETGKNNEDRYGVQSFYGEAGESITLGVIADGIGGNRAGEVASDLAVQNILRAVSQSAGNDYPQILNQAVSQAAKAVNQAALSNADLKGMGTTCAVALIAGRRLFTAYVGDSRIYLARRGGILQTSVDHTFVQEAIETGLLTPAEAKTHPHRHVVRRHLGNDPNVRADFRVRLAADEPPEVSMRNQGVLLEPGCQVLVCSDGLSDLVEAGEILQVLTALPPQKAVEELILLARKRGGHDNITVIAMLV
ncbi:MAG: serine/threonine-protein phosphatase [Anaerolineales bacterium]|nr:serine/threonine-protein phosphatase [Anaerolineales bacterium]